MNITLTPLHPRFGQDVQGIDLATLDAAGFAMLRDLFETHSLLLFRNQALDDAAHLRLAAMFGPIEDRNPEDRPKGEAMKVPAVTNLREDGTLTGGMDLHTLNLQANMLWHADSTFLPVPALTNILIARIVTKTGGRTEFASTRAAFADLDPAMKDRLRGLGFWHHYSHSRAQISPELAQLPMFHKWPAQLWRAVWRNPINGAEAIYVASHAYAVEGMPEAEGQTFLDSLREIVARPEYVFSHTWNVGDVLIWDQRAVLHRATPWNYDEPRKLTSLCVSVTDTDGLFAMKMGEQ